MEVGKKLTLCMFASSVSTEITSIICDFLGVCILLQPRCGHGSRTRGFAYGADPYIYLRFWPGGTKIAGVQATVSGTGLGGLKVSMTMRQSWNSILSALYISTIYLIS